MSHRGGDHGQAAERGNDWLDGALAGWLLFIAISTGQHAWRAARDGGDANRIVFELIALLLALAAVLPLLRFLRVGWILATVCLAMMAVREGMALAAGAPGWRAGAAFLTVHLLGLAYLLWIVPEFWPRHEDAEAAVSPDGEPEAAAPPAAPGRPLFTPDEEVATGPAPVTLALAAIHQRIVAAGSACAVTSSAVRADAGRFGVTPAMLRTEGLALYRTFLEHFLADGPLSPDEERELICLERTLDLDDDGVWRMRAEVVRPGAATASPMGSTAAGAPEAIPATAPSDAEHPIPATSPIAEEEEEDRGEEEEDRGEEEGGSPVVPVAGPSEDEAALPVGPDAVAAADDRRTPLEASATEPDTSATTANAPTVPREPATVAPPASQDVAEDATRPTHPGPSAAAPDVLADYEEYELGALLAWAGIPSVPPATPRRTALDRLRALHRTGTEPLEPCASDQPLEPGERCLAVHAVDLYRVPPGPTPAAVADVPGPVLDPRTLLDGTPERDRDLAGLQRTGACRLVITDRRLLLVAPAGQSSPLPLSRVRSVHPFRNGLEVQPRRGNAVFLAFPASVDAAMRIDRAARDLHA